MLLLKGIAGKAYIVGMLAKENGVKVASYKEELNTVPNAIIYDADTFEEFLQAICFELSRELRANPDFDFGRKYMVLYTNVHESIILRRTEHIKKIEDLYGIQLVITCKPNERYGGVSSGYTVNSAR